MLVVVVLAVVDMGSLVLESNLGLDWDWDCERADVATDVVTDVVADVATGVVTDAATDGDMV